MTVQELLDHVEKACDLDFSFTKITDDRAEYRINLRTADGGNEDTAYYTEDRMDAFATASDMAARRDALRTSRITYITFKWPCPCVACTKRRRVAPPRQGA